VKYKVLIEKAALKILKKIDSSHQKRIITAINNLGTNPRPAGCVKLSGRNAWRIRIGSYRVIYEIQDKDLIVLVVTLGNRKEIYR